MRQSSDPATIRMTLPAVAGSSPVWPTAPRWRSSTSWAGCTMNQLDSPFVWADNLLDGVGEPLPLLRFVDFHCELTSEKNAMGWYLDGRVTAVIGTHTHVPTADAKVLPQGTAYLSDVGMTGPRDSVIGFRLDTVLPRFLRHLPTRFEVAEGPGQPERRPGRGRSRHRPGHQHPARPAPGRGLTDLTDGQAHLPDERVARRVRRDPGSQPRLDDASTTSSTPGSTTRNAVSKHRCTVGGCTS